MRALSELFEQNILALASSVTKKTGNKFFTDTYRQIIKAMHEGEELFFTDATMRMLADKLRNYNDVGEELISRGYKPYSMDQALGHFTSAIIQFDVPIKLPTPIHGIFFSNPAKYMASGKNCIQLSLLDEYGQISENMIEIKDGEASFDPQLHQCISCKRSPEGIQLCEQCQIIMETWHKIFILSCIIAGQYLAARRYEEMEVKSLRRVPREKNPKKSKTVAVKHILKVIDATEICIPVYPPDTQNKPSGEQYSWLAEALATNPDSIEYRDITTRPFEREYRHPRYVNVKGTKQKFPDGIRRQHQPRLRGVRHITKVKSKTYENEIQ